MRVEIWFGQRSDNYKIFRCQKISLSALLRAGGLVTSLNAVFGPNRLDTNKLYREPPSIGHGGGTNVSTSFYNRKTNSSNPIPTNKKPFTKEIHHSQSGTSLAQ